MNSNQPYLIRAMYDWICDNELTPHILVNAHIPGVKVPAQIIKDNQVVLNVSTQAIAQLELGNDKIVFLARFNGASHAIQIPVEAVLAIYAAENSQGMMFQAQESAASTENLVESSQSELAMEVDKKIVSHKKPHLRAVK